VLSVYNSIDSVCVQTDYIHVTATRKHIHLAVIQLPLTIRISFQIHVASLTDWFILYIYVHLLLYHVEYEMATVVYVPSKSIP